MTTRKSNETTQNAKTQYELNTEIKNLNTKLKFEQNQRDELKRRYELELNAAKIRYDNELQKQNRLMKSKNQELENEINRLNESIKRLQEEKNALLQKMKLGMTEKTTPTIKHTSKTDPISSSPITKVRVIL